MLYWPVFEQQTNRKVQKIHEILQLFFQRRPWVCNSTVLGWCIYGVIVGETSYHTAYPVSLNVRVAEDADSPNFHHIFGRSSRGCTGTEPCPCSTGRSISGPHPYNIYIFENASILSYCQKSVFTTLWHTFTFDHFSSKIIFFSKKQKIRVF